MTVQQYFNAHKGERMHGYNGVMATLVGYHCDNGEGFGRLICELDKCDAFDSGWTGMLNNDVIAAMGSGSGRFIYVSVPRGGEKGLSYV